MFSLDWIKYLSYSEVQKNWKLLMFRSDPFYFVLNRNRFLVSEYFFKFSLPLWKLQVVRDLLCVICERFVRYLRKIFEQNVNVAYLKTIHQRCSVKKVLFQFHRKIHVLEFLFDKFTGLRAWGFLKKGL